MTKKAFSPLRLHTTGCAPGVDAYSADFMEAPRSEFVDEVVNRIGMIVIEHDDYHRDPRFETIEKIVGSCCDVAKALEEFGGHVAEIEPHDLALVVARRMGHSLDSLSEVCKNKPEKIAHFVKKFEQKIAESAPSEAIATLTPNTL